MEVQVRIQLGIAVHTFYSFCVRKQEPTMETEMKSTQFGRLAASAVVLCLGFFFQQANGNDVAATSLNGSAWRIAPENEIKASGEQLSKPEFASSGWVAAQVPGTVFGSYVIAGLEPEPTYGDNCYKVDFKKYDRNFWYRTEFTVPSDYSKGHIWMNLDGVNRDADIYVNGQKLGSIHGFFQRGRFDVTALVHRGGKNVLAVLDYLPELKAPATRPTTPFTPTVSRDVNYNSPSFICSRGWDWMPPVPGLNMGIYKDVYLTHTGDVSVIDPWIRTEVPSHAEGDVSIQADLVNHSTGNVSGELVGEINPGKVTFRKAVSLKPGEVQSCTLSPDEITALKIHNPKLWWPNGYGDPNLYSCHLEFRTGSSVSDAKDVTFGIKKYTYDTENDIMHFHINGVQIFPKGGSWGMAEFMLRCRGSDYDTKLRFQREENFNIIRNWMGMTADQAFYDACDKYGIMVWDELWLNSSGGRPGDLGIYQANVIEKIKQVRNHPSIAFWAADNEAAPPADISKPIAAEIKTYDGDDRRYSPNSRSGSLSGSGPWGNLEPKKYFIGVPTGGGSKQAFGMRSELGTATFVSYDSFKKFMPPETQWPENQMWNAHFYGKWAGNGKPSTYTASIKQRYGTATDIRDFCRKAQLLNIETMKAMFEGWLDHSDKDAAGLIIWMSQSAYPSMVWQTYDYYYDLTGSFWGAKSACEPVHIYWNQNDDRIRVVNTSGRAMSGLTAYAGIYNVDGTSKSELKASIDSSPTAVADCCTLNFPADLSPTHFIKLRLVDSSGKLISENFYWRGTKYLDYSGLSSLKPVKLAMTSQTTSSGDNKTIEADITNPTGSGTVALAIRPKLVAAESEEQILPVHMSDGYFSLLPGETKHVSLQFASASAKGKDFKVLLECWNNQNDAHK